MRSRVRRAALFIAAAISSSLVACGGGAGPAVPTAPEAGAETFAEVNPADLAELDAGSASSSPDSSKAVSASTPPPAPSSDLPPPPEGKDECTPIGVDFEKRARPAMKACYAEAKKKEPNLMGTVKIEVNIDTLGKLKSIKIIEKTLPDTVANCMLKVVKTTSLDAAKCPGKSLTIPMTFPTPH